MIDLLPRTTGGDSAPATATAAPPNYGPNLLPQHARLLADSAIAPEVAAARGYRSVTEAKDLEALGFAPAQRNVPGLLIPIHDVYGKLALHQYRPDTPRYRDGKPVKYETPAGARMALDVPPAVLDVVGRPSVPLVITEGARKADAAVSQGYACIAVLGVWNWRGSNSAGGKTVLANWEMVALNGRTVDLAFDSDVMTKPEVHLALTRLWAFLRARGAQVGVLYLPPGEDGQKVGLDDYLAAGGSMAELVAKRERRLRAPDAPSAEQRISQATRLVQLAAGADLFHTSDERPYATVQVDGHRETYAMRAQAFRSWLRRSFWLATQSAASAQALMDAVGVLEGKARYDGAERAVHVRVAEGEDGAIYLDLANDAWEAVRITADGWQLVAEPPVRFLRPAGMLALPRPVPGGSIDVLHPFVNVGSEADWRLLVGWLVGALRPRGPYPVLVLVGEQGTSKSTLARVLRLLIDTSAAGLRGRVRDEGDLMIACQNGWILALDNISSLPDWQSDAICRVASGAALTKRQLFTDEDEIILKATRPLILNGIGDFATRSDLLDRAIVLQLPVIGDQHRREEEVFYRELEAVLPEALGALLTAVSTALRDYPTTHLDRLPRMADFARWVTAAEAGFGWEPGAFLAAYSGNRAELNELALEASPVGPVLFELVAERGEWLGTAGELLATLEERTDERIRRDKGWPTTAVWLSRTLTRLAPNLRRAGVEVERVQEQGARSRKLVLLTRKQAQITDATDATDALLCNDASVKPNFASVNGQVASVKSRGASVNNSASLSDSVGSVGSVGKMPHFSGDHEPGDTPDDDYIPSCGQIWP